MTKLLKILRRILGISFEWLLIFVILLAFAIRTSPVQTYFAEIATNYLSEELKVTIKIDKVDIIFFDQAELKGVYLEDQKKDTLIYVKSLWAELDDYNLAKKKFVFEQVTLDGATINIERDENGNFGFDFIKDYFKSNKKSDPITLAVGTITIKDSRFKYDDFRKPILEKGVDYFHIQTKAINGEVINFGIKNNEYSGEITRLSCLEKSGFVLKDLNTKTKVSKDGIFLSDVIITSPGSRVNAKKFNMLSDEFPDFKEFVDSVRFDGTLEESIIDLKEGALFAHILDGMEDTITISGSLRKRVKNLKVENFDLRYGEKSQIKGTVNIPDYRKFESGFFHEKISYAYIDVDELKKLKLPTVAGRNYLSFDSRVNRLGYFEAEDIRLDGFQTQFVVASDIIRTALGDVRIDHGIMFTENPKNNSYMFERSGASEYDVKIEQLDLGKLLNNPDMGIVDGIFFLSGEASSRKLTNNTTVYDIAFHSIEGDMNRFDYYDYPYTGIKILEGTFEDEVFNGKIDVKDDNLDMAYEGMIDFKGELRMLFTVDIKNALLEHLHLTTKDSQLSSIFEIDLTGRDPNNFRGHITMNAFSLVKNDIQFNIPSLKLAISRGPTTDEFIIKSKIADVRLNGKLDFNYILKDLEYQMSNIFPSLFPKPMEERDSKKLDHFEFAIDVHDATDFMAIFFPTISIAPGTSIKGHYIAENLDLIADIKSDSISYQGMRFSNLTMHQIVDDYHIVANYHADRFNYNDSIYFDDIYFKAEGQNDVLDCDLVWAQTTDAPSAITWKTEIEALNHYNFLLDPSYFFIQDHRWDVAQESRITMDNDTIRVSNFALKRNDQAILIDGVISNSDDHLLNFNIQNFELNEVSDFVSEVPIEGRLNLAGYISNPINNFQYQGDADIYQLMTKGQLVGDVVMQSNWIQKSQSIAIQGDLNYKGHQTFDFKGNYYPTLKKNNLDFNLLFDYMDIQFLNAFMNPEVMSEIKGLLNGTLKVTGEPDKPLLDGDVSLAAGSAYVDILGAYFGVDGKIETDEYGFYINGIPVFDEDGNAGLLIGSIYHDNFSDFNFDLVFDLEYDAINKDPLKPWVMKPLDRFLIMNSVYEPGALYHGKGYATGMIDVFGFTDNLEITVDLETQKGTMINIPMYGIGDIEEESFIIFVDKDTTAEYIEPKIDFTGVDLNLNFHVTPAAEVKIIFNKELEDEITAHGYGDLDISLNNLGDVKMNGVYTVSDGVYDFAMGVFKEKFYIEKGGNISWTGDPYDAYLNLRTYYKVNANIAAVTNDQLGSGSGAHQEILCYLDLSQTLSKPAIQFDLAAPNANEEAKSIITRIKSDEDELNRQFFSLLLWKSFQPLAGTASADGSAAIDLVTNQINAMLAKVSDDYQMKVNMDSDKVTGDNTYEFGVSTGFLNDRLILSGSFGVDNRKLDESQNQSSIIGDVNLEYLLNESGTFRVNIFNESNDKTIIQNEDQGSFTQGAGLHYREDFHTIKDFKMVQYFLDIFRKKGKKRYPIKRKRKQVPVPDINN